jgi:hypothetical protein
LIEEEDQAFVFISDMEQDICLKTPLQWIPWRK